ncbi:MAG TPA: hypothetical protein VMS55_12485 [Myxococcota bacterium]|nr:hypothetical protein [Myxococcota bacterium]
MARALFALAALLVFAAAAPTRAVELVGTWYVLVHYKDDHSENPDAERWDDRVWVFEKDGNRLRWTEYPIAVFEDESGRFERRDTGQYARILHYWEPSEAQLADIKDGLQVNTRGTKTKTLRGSDAQGWSSGRRAGAASASVVTYEEVWSIDDPEKLPVFKRSDFMGSGRSDTLEGTTEYATQKIEGGVLSGSFERDGSRHGDFRMMPSGQIGDVKGAGTQDELQKKMIQREADRVIQHGGGVPGEWVDSREGADGVEGLREAGVVPALPRKGMRLEEVVAAVRIPPVGSNQKSALLRRLEVLRLRPDGFELLPQADVEAGAVHAVAGESYGVLALQFCSSPAGKGEYTSWYLVSDEGLVAWDHYAYHDQCVYTNEFEPATGERIAQERVITGHRGEAFPRGPEADNVFYAKGIALAAVGRVDDAKQMLARGDANLTVGVDGSKTEHTANRARLATRSTDDEARAQLVHAIEVAEKSASGATKSPPGP